MAWPANETPEYVELGLETTELVWLPQPIKPSRRPPARIDLIAFGEAVGSTWVKPSLAGAVAPALGPRTDSAEDTAGSAHKGEDKCRVFRRIDAARLPMEGSGCKKQTGGTKRVHYRLVHGYPSDIQNLRE